MFFEIFAVFLPAFQVIRLWCIRKKVADSNAKWETQSQSSGTSRSSTTLNWNSSTQSLFEKGHALDYLDDELGDRLLTMPALEHVLRSNPAPLQQFSALHDFSGENIAFLTRVSKWKTLWPAAPRDEVLLDAYNDALAIYANFISPHHAQFPLNLSSKELRHLRQVFEDASRDLYGEATSNPATPFDVEAPVPASSASNLTYRGEIPAAFEPAVFDRAENHVKYLVLTNTWPKFVTDMQSQRRSSETERSLLTQGSGESGWSRISDRWAKLLRDLGIN
jgi:hypothetical protein